MNKLLSIFQENKEIYKKVGLIGIYSGAIIMLYLLTTGKFQRFIETGIF